jgi:putative phosphoribosyl transferase
MKSAIQAVRRSFSGTLVVASPVSSQDSWLEVGKMADDVESIIVSDRFYGVGQFYEDFGQTDEKEVVRLLNESKSWEC